jgi:ATP-binding cassette, subfamily A (ABC1), member 5
MVVDKETKMRETLRIMSMKSEAYGLSYFITQLIFVVFISLLMTLTFGFREFLSGMNLVYFFFLMILNGISMTFYSMALTTLFSDSKIAV